MVTLFVSFMVNKRYTVKTNSHIESITKLFFFFNFLQYFGHLGYCETYVCSLNGTNLYLTKLSSPAYVYVLHWLMWQKLKYNCG